MTPEREEEIRKWVEQNLHHDFYRHAWDIVNDLLKEVDDLRSIVKEQSNFTLFLKKQLQNKYFH